MSQLFSQNNILKKGICSRIDTDINNSRADPNIKLKNKFLYKTLLDCKLIYHCKNEKGQCDLNFKWPTNKKVSVNLKKNHIHCLQHEIVHMGTEPMPFSKNKIRQHMSSRRHGETVLTLEL